MEEPLGESIMAALWLPEAAERAESGCDRLYAEEGWRAALVGVEAAESVNLVVTQTNATQCEDEHLALNRCALWSLGPHRCAPVRVCLTLCRCWLSALCSAAANGM